MRAFIHPTKLFSFVFIICLSVVQITKAQLNFEPGFPVENTFDPTDMILGDFDGDSFKDAIYINSTLKQINTIYHLDDPALRTFQSITVNPTNPGGLYHPEAGDFNHDGKTDLVIIEYGSQASNLVVLLSTGNTFSQNKYVINSSFFNYVPKVVDFDNDGNVDILLSNTQKIFHYKGDGHGTFAVSEITKLPSLVTISWYLFDVADLDVNGITDIIQYSSDTLYTFLNQGGVNGFITNKLYVPNIVPVNIKTGDLTGDGLPEIILKSVNGTASLLEFININGSFTSPITMPPQSIAGHSNIDVADYDKDGRQDLLVGGGDYSTDFILLHNIGSNQFSNSAGQAYNVQATESIFFSDIDNDGTLEIVELSFFKFIKIFRLVSGTYQISEKIIFGTKAYHGTVTDLNNDNKLDIVSYSQIGECVSVFYGNGNKNYSDPLNFTDNQGIRSMTINDFNNDGYKDILYSDYPSPFGASIFLVTSNNSAALSAKTTITSIPSYVLASGDFNNDGHMDFATDHGTYINNGSGGFYVKYYSLGFTPFQIDIGNFNNDSAIDLVFNDGGRNYISLNDGNGNFTSFTKTISNQYYFTVKSIKLNNDNFHDLISIQTDSNGNTALSILLSNGDGTFTINQTIAPPTGDQFGGYADAGDLDGDGLLDIAVGVGNKDYGFIVYTQDAKGNFNFNQIVQVSSRFGATTPDYIQVADTNADGKNDIVIFSQNLDPITILFNDLVTKPTQPPALTLVDKTDVSATFSIANGNGNGIIAIIRKKEIKNATPSNNVFYAVNSKYGIGATTGLDNYVVLLKDTTILTVTGLAQGASYTVNAYEYNQNYTKTIINYLTSSYDSVNFTTKKAQTLTIPTISDKIIGSAPFLFTVTSSSGLPVSLAPETSAISISSDTVKLLQPGQAKIQISNPGNSDYLGISQEVTFCVNPPVPSITVTLDVTHSYLLTSSSDTNNHWIVNGTLIDTATQKNYHPLIDGIYSVQVEAGTCRSTSDPTAYIITATEADEKNVSPNPFTDFVFVSGASDANNIQITNLNGQTESVTFDWENGRWRINTKSLNSGFYVVRIKTPDTVSYFKVIKSH